MKALLAMPESLPALIFDPAPLGRLMRRPGGRSSGSIGTGMLFLLLDSNSPGADPGPLC